MTIFQSGKKGSETLILVIREYADRDRITGLVSSVISTARSQLLELLWLVKHIIKVRP